MFMSKQGSGLGLSARALQARRRKNIVSAKCNFILWLLEVLMVLIFLPVSVFVLFYIIPNSCFVPLVYFAGIEENRQWMRLLVDKTRNVMAEIGSKMVRGIKWKNN